MPIELEALGARVFRDRIEQAILQAISSGDLKPGDQVNEVEIARLAGISRGPVREAIQHLVGEEILVSYPHRGAFVAEWNVQDIRETYGVRALLEGYSARMAVQHMSAEDMKELDEIVERMVDHAHRGDAAAVYDCDLEFHSRAYALSKHELLSRLLSKLSNRMHLFIRMDADTTPNLIRYAKNHYVLLEGLRSKNPDQAEMVFREHLETVGEELVRRFSQKPASTSDTTDQNGRS